MKFLPPAHPGPVSRSTPMHPLSRLFRGLGKRRHACPYRRRLESLEDRLPLGDALGWLLVCPAWGLTTAAEPGTFQLETATADRPPAEKPQSEIADCRLQIADC